MIQANCCNRYQAPSIFLDLRKYVAQEVRRSSAALATPLISCTTYIRFCPTFIRSANGKCPDTAVRTRHAFLILQKGDLS